MSKTPEMDRLMVRLFDDPGFKLLHFSLTPGDRPASPEAIAREVNSGMDQEANGTATVSHHFPDNRPKIDVRDLLEKL